MLLHDGPLLLPPDDPRSIKAARVATRLVSALEEQEKSVVSGAEWPPREYKSKCVDDDDDRLRRYTPSAVALSSLMPFRPVSSNPLKDRNIENVDWNIYIIDMVSRYYTTLTASHSRSMPWRSPARTCSFSLDCWTCYQMTTRCSLRFCRTRLRTLRSDIVSRMPG